MPTYSYRCKTCGKTQDKINKIADHAIGPDCCGTMMRQILTLAAVHPDFEPYLDEHMTDKPVLVKSKQHRKELMEKHNVSEAYGKGWY